MLQANGLDRDDIDILVSGMNGDSRNKYLVDPLLAGCSDNTTVAAFKHLSGEYDTASGFGLWLACHIISKQRVPVEVIYRQGVSERTRNILVVNITMARNATVMLVQQTA